MIERIFTGLLGLYPSGSRAKYKEEALQLYRARLAEETGLLRRARVRVELVTDLVYALPQACGNSYAGAGAASMAALPGAASGVIPGTPRFEVLEREPLTARSILTGTVLAFTAVA